MLDGCPSAGVGEAAVTYPVEVWDSGILILWILVCAAKH